MHVYICMYIYAKICVCKYIFFNLITLYRCMFVHIYVTSFPGALVSNNDLSQSSQTWTSFKINERISKAIAIYCYKSITNICSYNKLKIMVLISKRNPTFSSCLIKMKLDAELGILIQNIHLYCSSVLLNEFLDYSSKCPF